MFLDNSRIFWNIPETFNHKKLSIKCHNRIQNNQGLNKIKCILI